MSLDAAILAEVQRRITPIGTLQPYQNLGTEFTDPYSGMTWLRSGAVKSAAGYTQAAAHPALQVFGEPCGAPPSTSSALFDLATDGAGNVVACNYSTTTVAVSTNGGATWTTLAHNLGVYCASACWDATNSLWLFAGEDGANLKVSSTPDLSTAATLRFTSTAATFYATNSALIRSSGGNSVVVAYGGCAAYSNNGTSWTQIGSPDGSNTPRGLAKNGSVWAVTYSGYALTSSDGGATWGSMQSQPAGSSGQMTAGNGVFLLFGSSGQVYTSATAATGSWTQYRLLSPAGENISASRACGGFVDGAWRFVTELGVLETSDLAQTRFRRMPADFTGGGVMLVLGTGGKFCALVGNSATPPAAYGTSLTVATYVGVPKACGPSLPDTVGKPYYYARIK